MEHDIAANTARDFLHRLVDADQPGTRPPRFDDVLEDLGVAPGQPVMVAMPNGGEFVAVVLALLVRGAVPVLLPPAAPPSRIERMGQALGANTLIAPRMPPGLSTVDLKAVGGVAEFGVLPGLTPLPRAPGEIILLTSGTSGVFSGCLHRVESLLRNGARHAQAVGQTAADRVLINLPLHYSYAFVAQLLATFTTGGQAVIARPPFTPARYLRTIEDHEITLSSLTPPMVEPVLVGGKRLPGVLRGLTVGGGGLGVEAVREVLARHPDLELYLTYGLTEAGPRVSTLAAHLAAPRHHASVGLPLPGVGVRLRPRAPGDRVGELVVETDTGMLRRVGRADETPLPPGADGRRLIATGDEFELDDEGYLFFRGRRPGFVVNRGEKISPQSVCEIAELIPGVRGAQAWLRETDTGEFEFTLDVYCATDLLDERDVRRRLAKVLLRSEQPAHVLIHPATHLGWRKSAAD